MSKSAASKGLARAYPWVKSPVIIGAPMRVMSGANLATAITKAGGLGFIGPGAKSEDTGKELESAKTLLSSEPRFGEANVALPVGVGFQTWNGDINAAASAVGKYQPCAAWLFAPRHGQEELDQWTQKIRAASPNTQVWIQVGTVVEAVAAARSDSAPDVLVIQGAEAGGHGRSTDGIGLISLFPEVHDEIRATGKDIQLVAAGGIADARGVVAALGLGAAGVTMGTRFLAASEAKISKGYQDEVVRAKDAATSTTRTQLYNHLRGTFGWPAQWSPRTIINKSWQEQQAGASFEQLQEKHDEAVAQGDAGWGPDGRLATYAGASIGLVREVEDAGTIVKKAREGAIKIIEDIKSQQ